MKHHLTRASSDEALKNRHKGDLQFFSHLYDISELSELNLKKVTNREMAIIKAALAQADKLRMAAWDPGAAYLSGIADALSSVHKKSPTLRITRRVTKHKLK